MSKRSDAVARWQEILRRQASSGLSVAAFCRRSCISQPSFYVWRRRLQEAGTFAEVRVSPESSRIEGVIASRWPQRDSDLEVVLSHGHRIVVRPGFDRATLLALVDALEPGSANGSHRDSGP